MGLPTLSELKELMEYPSFLCKHSLAAPLYNVHSER